MDILHYNTAKSRHSFTSRAGLMVPAVLPGRPGLGETVDGRMPGPGSNRGYRHGMTFETFMPTFQEGAECLEDVRHRPGEHALTGLMGFRLLPCAATLGNGLRRVGRDRASRVVLQEANRRVPGRALQDRDRVTLDIDALPEGAGVSRFRADAAPYQASVVNACREHGARFAIRARADRTVRAAIAAVPEDAWQPLPREDGSLPETESVARTVPVMGGIAMPDREPVPIDGERTLDDRYLYRTMTTDLDREGWSDREIVCRYNRRADASENRLKELRSDFGGAHLPCSGFRANAVVLALSAIAYSLLCLMRLSLPPAWHGSRAGTFRHRLYAMAGQVVRHARQWTLKVGPARPGLLEETLWRMRTCRLF